LLDLQLESVGEPTAVVLHQLFDVGARSHASLLEMEQLAPRLLGVDKRTRDADQLVEGQQRGAHRHEHGALERVAPSARRFRGA
jgi:hypothetical protein